MAGQFDVPVVVFIFLRTDTVLQIVERMRQVKPSKVYVFADAGRNSEERKLSDECRKRVVESIDWDCEIIKSFAEENRGVYGQIALGAKYVFEREETAIFLEDDNLPEVTFFEYCRECLDKYRDEEDILWICGTNYLEKCSPKNGFDVFKSRHLMPCGWASWSRKFLRYYDFELSLTNDLNWKDVLKRKYSDRRLYEQQKRTIEAEAIRAKEGRRYASWDYHMCLSIRMNDKWGIVPKYNQIENIGVDQFSTHGGNSMALEMTKRFCGISSYSLEFPLRLPDYNDLSAEFESDIGKIILFPFKARVILFLRDKLKVPDNMRLRDYLTNGIAIFK